MSGGSERALVALGAVAGFCGVAGSAAAAHVTGGGSLDTAARVALLHAPVLLAVPALIGGGAVHPGLARGAGFGLALGLLLFCGDLSVRALLGVAPLPMAAPAGGMVLLAGWAALGLAAVLRGRASGPPQNR